MFNSPRRVHWEIDQTIWCIPKSIHIIGGKLLKKVARPVLTLNWVMSHGTWDRFYRSQWHCQQTVVFAETTFSQFPSGSRFSPRFSSVHWGSEARPSARGLNRCEIPSSIELLFRHYLHRFCQRMGFGFTVGVVGVLILSHAAYSTIQCKPRFRELSSSRPFKRGS